MFNRTLSIYLKDLNNLSTYNTANHITKKMSIFPAKLFWTKFEMDTKVLHTITHFTCADHARMNNISEEIQLPFNIRVFNTWLQLNLSTRMSNNLIVICPKLEHSLKLYDIYLF